MVAIDQLRKGAHYLAAEQPCGKRAQSVCACKPNEYGELPRMIFLRVFREVGVPTKTLQIPTVLRFHFIPSSSSTLKARTSMPRWGTEFVAGIRARRAVSSVTVIRKSSRQSWAASLVLLAERDDDDGGCFDVGKSPIFSVLSWCTSDNFQPQPSKADYVIPSEAAISVSDVMRVRGRVTVTLALTFSQAGKSLRITVHKPRPGFH